MTSSVLRLFAVQAVLSVAGLVLLRSHLSAALPLLRHGQVVTGPVAAVGLGGLLYASSFAVWLAILRVVPLVRAYPVSVGLTMALTTLAGTVLLHEHLSGRIVIGVVVVFAGVVLLSS